MTDVIAFVVIMIGEVIILGQSILSATPVEVTMTTKVYRLFHQVKQVKNKFQSKYYISRNISAS